MVYVVGPDHRVEYVNGRGARGFGVPAEELVGRPLAGMFGGETAVRIVAAVASVLASGEPYETGVARRLSRRRPVGEHAARGAQG